MKYTLYILFFLSATVFAQAPITTSELKEIPLDADQIYTIDNFGTMFYQKDNVFFKKTAQNTLSYNNIQLGDLTSVNTFNPLKINLFYKDFNTVIILDNRLAEIFKIDFNLISPYKNVSHIAPGFDNSLWFFNQDLQKLELFDYKTNTSKAQTVPVQSEVLDLKSNYNYCWLLTKNYLYTYNYFGSLVSKMKNDGFSQLAISNKNVILKKDNTLYYLKENNNVVQPVQTPILTIKHFFATNETLYIYDHKTLHQLQLKIE